LKFLSSQIIDMLQKEEMLKMESNIKKVLGGATPVYQTLTTTEEEIEPLVGQSGKSKDVPPTMTRPDDEFLTDAAEDLTEQQPEEHIKEMFEQTGESDRQSMRVSGEAGKDGGVGGSKEAKGVANGNQQQPPPMDLK